MSFASWVTDLLPGSDQKRVAELDKKAGDQQQREAGRKDETFWGTNTPVQDDHDVNVKTPGAGTTEKTDEKGWSFLTDTWKRIRGQSTTTSGVDSNTGQQVTATSTSGSSTAVDPAKATLTNTTDHGSTSVKVLDIQGMVTTAKLELEARKTDKKISDEERAKIDAQLARLNNKELDEAALKQIVVDNNLRIRAQYKETQASSDKTTTSVDGLNGTASRSNVQSSSVANADGTTSKSTNQTDTKVTAGLGALTGTRTQTDTVATTDAAGNTTSGRSDSKSNNVSVLGGANGHGVGIGQQNDSSNTTTTTDQNGNKMNTVDKTSTQVGGKLTDKGASTSASTTNSTLTNDTRLHETKTSADGSFQINIAAIPGSSPAQYQVTMTLSAGAALAVKEAKVRSEKLATTPGATSNTGSVTGSAAIGASLTFTHVMDEKDAREYMTNVDKVDAGGGPEKVAPEFGVLGKLKAIQKEGGGVGMGAVAAMGGSQSAALLKDGESVDMNLNVDVRAGVAAGRGNAEKGDAAKSASVDASYGHGHMRSVHVAKTSDLDAKGKHMVDVTVTFLDKEDWKAGASVSAEGVSLGANHASASSTSQGVTVRLDVDAPDYGDKFQQVSMASDLDGLKALASQIQQAQTTSTTNGGSVGAGGATLNLGNTQSSTDQTNKDKDAGRVYGNQTGSNQDTVKVTQGSGDTAKTLYQDNTTNTASTNVDKKGMETTIEQKEEKSDLTRSLKDGATSAWSTVTGVFSSKDNKSKESKAGTIADAVTSSPQEKLKTQLDTTYADLDRYSLTEADVETVVQRAGDAKSWGECNSSPYYIQAWEAFRVSMLNPPIKPDEAEINKVDARRLGLGRVMAEGMKTGGGRAMTAVTCVLRHWQQGDVFSAKSLGAHFEWPESLKATRIKYEDVHARGRLADDTLAGFSGKNDALSRAQKWHEDTARTFDEVKWAVRDSNDVDPHAKGEMINSLSKEKQDVDEAYDRHLPALKSGQKDTQGTKDAAADPTVVKGPPTAEETNKHLWRRSSDILELLNIYKGQETAAYARARAVLPKNIGGNVDTSSALGGTYRSFFKTNWDQAQNILAEVGNDTHKGWIEVIKELRGIYEQLQVPKQDWHVTGVGETPRNPRTEPDVQTLNALVTPSDGVMQHDYNLDARKDEAMDWLKRWNTY